MPTAFPSPDRTVRRAAAPGARSVLVLASLSTTAAALWLLWVSVTVLPARDPARAGAWRIVAAALLAFAAASLASLRPGVRGAAERLLLTALGVVAVGIGLGAAVRILGIGRAGGHFEGYLLLLGALVALHGAAALAVALSPAQGKAAQDA